MKKKHFFVPIFILLICFMYIESLSIEHFRNHTQAFFSFASGVNVIIGENGRGKTNILEAVACLSSIKPFRNPKKEVFIEHGQSWAKIQGSIVHQNNETENLELFWSNDKKFHAKKNDIPYSSAKEWMKDKQFLCVLFSPEDLFLPMLSPSARRNLLSRILSPLFPEYFENAMLYEKALKQRNALLKQKKEGKDIGRSEFVFWENALSQAHDILKTFHTHFFTAINEMLENEYYLISTKKEEVYIKAENSCKQGELQKMLEENFMQDIARGSTSIGIHRDDFMWYLRGLPLGEDASRGESRSVILAFKQAEKKYIEMHTHSSPIILLDDVFSELDHVHQEHLLSSLLNTQSIITTTEMPKNTPTNTNIIRL